MNQITGRTRRILTGRASRVMAVSTLAIGAVVAGATTASATTTCNSGTGYAMCFEINPVGNNDYSVYFGIDVYMSRADAQTFIDHPGDEFVGKLMGDDPIWDNFIKYVPVAWSAASDIGLSAEFYTVVDGSVLDEDWDGRDELYGRISLWDPRTNTTRYFKTNVITGYYN